MIITELNKLSILIGPIFYKLLYMSIAALVIGMIIMIVRKFADKRISPFWKSMMWILVLVALVVPYRPQSELALLNKVEQVQRISYREEYDGLIYNHNEEDNAVTMTVEQGQDQIQLKAGKQKVSLQSLVFDICLPLVWVFGVILTALFMVGANIRLKWKINEHKKNGNMERYVGLLEKCKQKLGITRNFQIILQDYIGTPALMGFRPTIVLPVYLDEMEDTNVEYILLHELTHYKRGDVILNHLLLVLQTVYWFNPLTWWMFQFIRQDMELANDGAVLKTIGSEKQKEYSRSLVEVLARYNKVSFVPKLLCMVDNKENMERRIKMIKLGEAFKKKKVIIGVVSLLIIGVVGMLFLTSGMGHKIPPLYVSTSYNETIEAIRGGYHWEFGTIFKTNEVADALMPLEMEYTDATTLICEPGQQIVISKKKSNYEKSYEHTSLITKVYNPDGTLYEGVMNWEDFKILGNEVYLNVPSEIGDYIYMIEIEYERGKVNYGFKVIVTDVIAKSFAQQLFDNKNPYIGDTSANGKILELLNISEELGNYGLELQTSSEPYSIKLNFKDMGINREKFDLIMHNNALIILALIENAGEVHWSYPSIEKGQEVLITMRVRTSSAKVILGQDIKGFGKSAKQMQELLDKLLIKPKLTLKDVIRLSAKGEELTWQDFKPYQGSEIGSGLYIIQYPIDSQYSVTVGGGSLEEQPLYIYLSFSGEDGVGDSIDLLKDDVGQFIRKHNIDVSKNIDENLKIIVSSPTVSSNPYDYIEEHKEEFDTILKLDSAALAYFFSEFEKGGQTGLDGHIMAAACREILISEDIKVEWETGQDWYEAYKEYLIKLKDEKSEGFVKKEYPKGYLLLELLGNTGEDLP